MPVLVIVSMQGPTSELLAASEKIERGIGMPAGLLARVVAPSENGIVLVNLWATENLRRASNDDPEHQAVVDASGLTVLAEKTTLQHFEAARVDLAATT